MPRLLLQGSLVLPDADTPPAHRDILIEDGRISALLAPGTSVDDVHRVDAAGMLAHPGLVNAHMHAHTPLTKGMADRWSLEVLLASGMRIYGSRSDEDRYTSALTGAVELAIKGCTTVYDMCLEMPLPTETGIAAVARAYADAGLRAVIAPMVSDRSFFQATLGLMDALPETVRSGLAQAGAKGLGTPLEAMRLILRNWPWPRERVRPALAPTIPLHCSDELLLGCRDLRDEYGLGIQSHLQESKIQALSGIGIYGETPTAHLDRLGLLGRGFVASHGVWLDDDDMDRLGRAGASVAHNPGSNTILGSGLADVRRMMELGINVAIGTDGANCSDNLNMYESMRAALRVSHVRGPDMARWLSAREVFRAATVGSAQACGFDDIGRLAPGYRADIVLLDLTHPNWLPVNDVLVQLVQSEDGGAVHSVMVGGEWVVREHRPVHVDLRVLRQAANAARQRLLEAGRVNESLYRELLPVVQCFCPAMARQAYRVERYGAAEH